MQRLLVSVRGPKEALAAARGGAQLADVEYPGSALGTPYPLNILAVCGRLRSAGFQRVRISTNIGEEQRTRGTSCQAALGVALAGATHIKFGLAGETLEAGTYVGRAIVRTVRHFFGRRKKVIPAVFVDEDLLRYLDPFAEGPRLAQACQADALLIDTFNKSSGVGLLDRCTPKDIASTVRKLHRYGQELWVAGSLTRDELPVLWAAGVDVVCVRGAACSAGRGSGRFGAIAEHLVHELAETIP